jgi:hypothetical protein
MATVNAMKINQFMTDIFNIPSIKRSRKLCKFLDLLHLFCKVCWLNLSLLSCTCSILPRFNHVCDNNLQPKFVSESLPKELKIVLSKLNVLGDVDADCCSFNLPAAGFDQVMDNTGQRALRVDIGKAEVEVCALDLELHVHVLDLRLTPYSQY